MTIQDAKNKVANNRGRKSFYTLLCFTLEPSEVSKAVDEACQIYGDSQYNQGIDHAYLAILNSNISLHERDKLLEELKKLKR